MPRKDGINFNYKIDKGLLDYFQREAPEKLKDGRKKAVEAAGMVWADETKEITTAENHIDTGLYVNSIGYATGDPADPLYNLQEGKNETILDIGADVEYAGMLEKRYSLMARGLDVAKPRMRRVAVTQIKNSLGL